MPHRTLLFLCLLILFFAGCSTSTKVLNNSGFTASSVPADSIIAKLPDYSNSLNTIRGSAKAIISEPGNTERVTIYFSGNRQKSLIRVKNSLGIEGADILSGNDSLLIYNKVDKKAQRISLSDPSITGVGHLASVNIVKMMNFIPIAEQVRTVYNSNESYLLILKNGINVFIDKKNSHVLQINQPMESGGAYSQIIYESYGTIEGFILPRRVTIFSNDKSTKIALLIQSIEVNPENLDLTIDIPEDIKIVTP